MSTPAPQSSLCRDCAHWHELKSTSGRIETSRIGECRATAPIRDFAWPRTREEQSCGRFLPRHPLGIGSEPFSKPLPPTAREPRGDASMGSNETARGPEHRPARKRASS